MTLIIKRLPMSLLFSLALTGCTTGFMSPNHPYDYIYGKTDDELKASIVSKAQLELDEKNYYAETDETKKRDLRNKIIGELRSPIDEFWRRYASSFYGNTAMIKTSFESTTTVLSGAAAITKPPNAASILAALSSAIGAIGTSVDKNFLQQQTSVILLHQMEADVELYGKTIAQGLTKSIEDYPLEVALADLATYSRSMSVPSALASINAAVGSQAQAVKNKTQSKLE